MDVAVVARSEQALVALADELSTETGARVHAVTADVAEPASVRRAATSTEAALGRIDLLVNNAGVSERGDARLWEAESDDWWQVMTTNIRGPMLFCQAVVPGMVQRGTGRIVNINSLRAVHPLPTQTAYGISKAALGKLTQALGAGLAGTGVLVFDYSPGRVLTDLAHQLGMADRPDAHWTPMERAVDGVVRIAEGSLDALAGRFLHAHDDWDQLGDRAAEIVRGAGRAWTISPAFPDDPLASRRVGTPATGSP
jgi:short-subunit dehydrogenase